MIKITVNEWVKGKGAGEVKRGMKRGCMYKEGRKRGKGKRCLPVAMFYPQ